MKNIFRKSLVIGIFFLFIGATIIPNIIGNDEKTSKPDELIKVNYASSLFFTENIGQFPEEVLYQIHTSGPTIYLCQTEIVSVFSQKSVKESEIDILSIVANIVDANPDANIIGENILPHYNNYFIGNDPNKWYTEVPNYEAVRYRNILPGIDLRIYNNMNLLKYDFIVSSGADPSTIKIQYEGMKNLFLTPAGDIQIDTNFGSIYEKKPFIYQTINGAQHEIAGRYEIIEPDIFGFAIDENYNPSYPIVIDPTLVYSTYLGGTNYDIGREIEVDNSGNAYIVGETDSVDFPTQNPYQGTVAGFVDAFVTKLSTTGNNLIYSTYLGGNNFDYGIGIGIDNSGFAYITGTTFSSDFPTFAALFPTLSGPQDAFVTKLSTTGNSLMYSTYLGGSNWEWSFDIAVDGNGNAYVIGDTDSADFPIFNAYDSSFNSGFDVFVSKFDPPGGILMYSTYLGGSNQDIGNGIDFDSNGNAYVTGYTWSSNYPVTPATAYDSSYNGGGDIVVNILDTITGGSGSLLYGTYIFGQGDDFGYDIATDNSGIVYVTGETESTINQFFPVTTNAYQQYLFGIRDAFFFKLDPSLTPANQMLYCSYLGGMTGGGGHDGGWGIDLDSNNNAYIVGTTECSDFPLVNPLGSYNGGNEAFASLFDPTASGASSLLDSTYIGGTNHDEGYGIAIDNNDDAYITGLTYSTNFPTQNPYQNNNNGLGDAFVTKVSPTGSVNNPPNKPAKPSGPTSGRAGTTYTYTSYAIDPEGDNVYYLFDWGDGTDSGWVGPYASGSTGRASHSWTLQGSYQIIVKAKDDPHAAESTWSDPLSISMPISILSTNTLLRWIIERYPNMLPQLRLLLRI